jgi:hypothetical protein
VKHQYSLKMEDYTFSSFNYWVSNKGMNWIMSVFEQYPIVDFSIHHDDSDDEHRQKEIL